MNIDLYRQAAAALQEESERLRSLLRSLKETGLGAPETRAAGELSSYDQHPADQGSETFEREKDYGLLLATYEQLAQVERARQSLAQGAYGICAACGWPISPERLAALPAASLCIHCKRRQESETDSRRRPVEEAVLSPPFRRTFHTGVSGFDGEDAWQALARYGTANTPQDAPDGGEFPTADYQADEEQGLVERTDGIIDLAARRVVEQGEIYAEAEENRGRQPRPAESAVGGPEESSELDDDLWRYLHVHFPGAPELEIARELTPAQLAFLGREYREAMAEELPEGDSAGPRSAAAGGVRAESE
jgi:YteA family regulatory protein